MLLVEIQGGTRGQYDDMMSHDLCSITLTLMTTVNTISKSI